MYNEQNLIEQFDPSSTAEWGIIMIAKIEKPSYQSICTGWPFFCGSCYMFVLDDVMPRETLVGYRKSSRQTESFSIRLCRKSMPDVGLLRMIDIVLGLLQSLQDNDTI